MKLTKQRLKEIIREELLTEGNDINVASDMFTRYILGDTQVASSQLSRSRLKFDVPEFKSEEYNKLFKKLHNAIVKAIKSVL